MDGLGSIFTEVFARCRDGTPESADHTDDGATKGGEGPGSGADAAAVLVHADVAHVVQLVLDGPVIAHELKQPFGSRVARREAGDQIDDFGALPAADPARAFEAGDLAQAGPIEMGHGFRTGRNGSRFDAAMRLADRFGST